MTLTEFRRRFITVHKCGGCGQILDYEHTETAFCDKCRLDWNAATTVGCPTCFKPARECACMPKLLSRAGALCLRKLFFYQSEDVYSPHMNMVHWLKKRHSKRMTQFVCDEMAAAVDEELRTLGVLPDCNKIIVTNVPRSWRAKAFWGFDQSADLARAIAASIGAEYVRLFTSAHSAKQQKKLDSKGRMLNAKRNIRFCDTGDCKERYVLLVDDMVTTGASMSVCVKKLMEAGARGVVCFSLASKNVKNR